ncbi:MAG: hypothetical protein CBB92_07145 [Flammeovirgaceae bacterium TMED32]|mgnify:FL=1|nr:MAG: hypothetical protein CBB92_07145 [Flammeovirgaceae bacterium TMED32]
MLALFYLYRYQITLVPVPPRFNQRSKKLPIENGHLYRKKDLKISELSSKSNLIADKIRIVLNENRFDNFKDFCNHYRLLDAER